MATTPRNGELLLVVLSVVRWGVGGPGRCADCHQTVDERHSLEPKIRPPSERVRRLSLIAPGTRAESAHIDEWAWEQMQIQLGYRPARSSSHGGKQKPLTSHKLCFDCICARLEAFQQNDTGSAAAVASCVAHALTGRPSFTAMFRAIRAGFEYQRIDNFLGLGCGSNWSVRRMVEYGIDDWWKRERAGTPICG
jgi:hypothetical protein